MMSPTIGTKGKKIMTKIHSYACSDYPGMEACPARLTAETEDEVWKLMELHAAHAHGEDPTGWSNEDRAYLKTLIKSEQVPVSENAEPRAS